MKRPLVEIRKELRNYDYIYVCKNGYQASGIEINEEIAKEIINQLEKYLKEKTE